MTVHCPECGKYYQTVKARSMRFNLLILYYAICPHCKTPRIPLSVFDPRPRCIFVFEGVKCNIPIIPGTKNPKGHCRAHYIREWKLHRKSLREKGVA